MDSQPLTFHLVFEDLRPGVPGASRDTSPDPAEICEDVRFLRQDGRSPRFFSGSTDSAEDLFIFEAIRQDQTCRLLMLSPGERRAWLNGRPAPPVALLEEKDEVRFDRFSGLVAHVAIFRKAAVGPPPASVIGQPCKLCRVKFTAQSLVYTCHRCGTALHFESGEDKPEEERLQCALLASRCLTCDSPIVTRTGYASLPEW